MIRRVVEFAHCASDAVRDPSYRDTTPGTSCLCSGLTPASRRALLLGENERAVLRDDVGARRGRVVARRQRGGEQPFAAHWAVKAAARVA